MNAIPKPEFLSVIQNVLDAYEPDAPFLFATPSHTLLARDVVERVPHGDEPLGARVQRALARAREQGHGDAAVVGAVPFDVERPTALSVVRAMRRGGPLADVAPPLATHRGGHDAYDYDARAVPPGAEYAAAVAQAVASIRAGHLDKVVLARTLELTGARPVDVRALIERLAARNPHGYTFSVDVGDGRTLLGASPELLVSRFQGVLRANPLAGSAPRSSDPVEDRRRADALLESAKDLDEHRVVVDAVKESLAPFCKKLAVPARPSLVHTQTMWHLSTEVAGETSADALTLALALHPTPAVCGYPRSEAREAILRAEPFDRGFYAGTLGWVDARGDGEWIVTIRCAQARGATLRLFAGAGIVGDSVPEAELAETAAKFRTMLDAMGVDRSAATDAIARAAA
ncbi:MULTISPECIES: isochorismate synthase [Burkholderia]|uniref:isochorismate synthase n=1 Tax=Burkholderia TaxID=32008 RepID=UPI00075CA44C|nr:MULTISPECIES: isochorismate synthase [Burkholderia]AOJ67357.1 isochorismate synthase [Burkholderia savannae]KVG43300.1 isochorismate synthase [Burkholderia sp. MSMB0265]KVG81472.1 isochorismate synthase [Burkholderia sp. MSMB2040]KVG91977.1 isochorismate synthase [Burkholderia sp. MSMB2041]KVG93712.1 isochorismate synthase [Burkholderia sp. MSMB2042]